MITPAIVKKIYDDGLNVLQYLRESDETNSINMIELSYDLQAGSYISAMNNPQIKEYKNIYACELVKVINSLGNFNSILEAGVGEATTFGEVLSNINNNIESYGFDLSWSRVAYAKRWLESLNIKNNMLCVGELLNIPFSSHSIDIVYTSHSIEPNRGRESEILKELFRVTRKYLILLEPAYELASDEARARMDTHGYCRNLKVEAENLGYKVITHELFSISVNPLNPTAITIIEKLTDAKQPGHVLACPQYHTELKFHENVFFSQSAMSIYPVVGGIPCLRKENAIIASKFEDFLDT